MIKNHHYYVIGGFLSYILIVRSISFSAMYSAISRTFKSSEIAKQVVGKTHYELDGSLLEKLPYDSCGNLK